MRRGRLIEILASVAATIGFQCGDRETRLTGPRNARRALQQFRGGQDVTTEDWSKPKAKAIPKEGYSLWRRDATAPPIPEPPPATASRSSRRSSPGPRPNPPVPDSGSSRRSTAIPTRSPRCGCTTCAGCCSTSARRSPSSIRVCSTPTSTCSPRTPSPCSGQRASTPSSKSSKASRRTGRPILQHSSSSYAITSVRASSSTGEYPFVSAAEIKKALTLKRAFSDMLDQMQ